VWVTSISDQFRNHTTQRTEGDGKTDVFRARTDRGVDANQLPSRVEQRAARITWIDGRVSLNHVKDDPF
jgi:hypothetical protein